MRPETQFARIGKTQVRRFPEGARKRCGTVCRVARPNVSPGMCLLRDTPGTRTHGTVRMFGGAR
jgi:hypothetical protein